MLTPLFCLFYVTGEFHRFLHRGTAQICLPNGSLEEFNKYIYRKPVDLELWRRNVLNTCNYIYRMTAGILKTKRNVLPNTIYSGNKSDVLHL